jgi:phosphoheptose isomerase
VRRIHQKEADEFPDVRFRIEERIVAEADAIIAECPQDKSDLMRLYNADPSRIVIIPCGFDPGEMEPVDKAVARAELGIPMEERVVLQLGRMVPRKGVENVIRGFARLDSGIRTRLLVVGGESEEPDPALTPEIGRLQGIAEEEGVADRVTFTGRRGRDALRTYYGAADVFVTTPWYEPFGITPVEAMACGRPVIGAEVGGIKYTVVDGETGYLVPPKDPEALAERLGELLQNPALLKRLGRQALQRANNYFTWEKVTQSIADLYEDVIAVHTLGWPGQRDPLTIIDRAFGGAVQSLQRSWYHLRVPVQEIARLMHDTFMAEGKVMVCGNGGSAADAQHLAAELVGRFRSANRPGLPVIALTSDSAVLTAWSNDTGYEDIFARQVQALGRPGDLLVGISTSGRSKNLLAAFETARRQNITSVAIVGKDGGPLLERADAAILVPSQDTQRIQEVHTFILHLLCELVEEEFLVKKWVGGQAARPSLEGGTSQPSTQAILDKQSIQLNRGEAQS